MTQEEFARKFHVTRQTVSNWENEKSYPDLLTLVNISNEFQVSLDSMLKEDKQMASKLNKEIKIGRKAKVILLGTIGSIIFLSVVWLLIWNDAKSVTEKKFQQGIQQNEFVFDGQLEFYIKTVSNETYYEVPNQKMPPYWDFSTDFYAKQIDCFTNVNNQKIHIRWIEKDAQWKYRYAIDYLDSKGRVETSLSIEESEQMQETNADIREVIAEGNKIYDEIYKD
jgi:transcriptional regulator with XRE-family HTH domain